MSLCLRVAILVDPLAARVKGCRHARALARELLARGHTVRGFGAPPGAIPRSGADIDDSAMARVDGALGVAHFRPDVVLAYDALSPAAWRASRVARKLSLPLVLVEAGVREGGASVSVTWERTLRKLGKRMWGRYVRRTASALVALDPIARQGALREGFSSAYISILPEGVDLNLFRPGISSALITNHRVRGRILLHIGPLERAGGAGLLVKAFAATVGQRGDWSLVLAGDGAEASEVQASAVRLGVGARVHILGSPREEEVPGLLGCCTLFANAADDDCDSAQWVAQAMSCGRPVLVSDLARHRFLVAPEGNDGDGCGLLAPPGDVEAWSSQLRRASSAPEARARWGRRARSMAEERLAWPRVAEGFERVLIAACGRTASAERRQGAVVSVPPGPGS